MKGQGIYHKKEEDTEERETVLKWRIRRQKPCLKLMRNGRIMSNKDEMLKIWTRHLGVWQLLA